MKDLVIVGAGGHAREVHQLLEDINVERTTWNVLGFVDDDASRRAPTVHGLPVLGPRAWLATRRVAVALGVGVPQARRRLVRWLAETNRGITFPVLRHPLATVGNRVEVGVGTIVFPRSTVTTDLHIGEHVLVNLGCTLTHDSELSDFVTLGPGVHVSGAVRIGEGCDLGTGSTIIQGVSIGEWSIIGAGAVVVRDIPPNVTAVGTPATPIKQRQEGWHER